MTRPVKKLSNLDIDEVSVVDRPANQHGVIAFAKADTEEDGMPIFDEQGNPLDEADLELGQVVFDENDQPFTVVDESELEYDDEDDRELAGVGKSVVVNSAGEAVRYGNALMRYGSREARFARGKAKTLAAGRKVKEGVKAQRENYRAGRAGLITSGPGGHLGQYRNEYLRGGAAFGAGGVGGAAVEHERAKKSLGDTVLEELSKAVSEDERQQIVAKAMDEVAKAQQEAQEARELAWAERDARVTSEFIAKAEHEYNLPISPEEFGPILKALYEGEPLTEEQVQALDERVFKAVSADLYDEIGYVGNSNPSVLDQVAAVSDELVGKSDGVTGADAMTAIFSADPTLYDTYLAEQNGR